MTDVRALRWLAVASLLSACGSDVADAAGNRGSAQPASEAASAAPGAPPHACELITTDEIKALAPAVVLRNRMVDEPTYTECQWEGKDEVLISLKVYTEGGRERWDTWRRAQGMGEKMLKQAEGVSMDSVLQQGLVSGIGDGAYFSPILPSLILKGDVLLELTLPGVERPETKFRRLATAIVGRI
jgi:hypothetical protein